MKLSTIDAAFLALDAPRQHGHIASLTVYDAAALGDPASFGAHFRERVEQRLPHTPVLTRRVRRPARRTGAPVWETVAVDLDDHIRQVTIPAPGDVDALRALAVELLDEPLDRERPLWRCWVIDGLHRPGFGAEAAVLFQVHHAAIDGMGGVGLIETWLSEDPPASAPAAAIPASTSVPRAALDALDATRSAVRELGVAGLAVAPSSTPLAAIPAIGAAARMPRRVLETLGAAPTPWLLPDRPAPRTPFNGSLSGRRHTELLTIGLEPLHEARRAIGVTLNDAVLAACATALRTWLDERGELPADPLVALVPIALGGSGGANRVGAMLASLHTDIADPHARASAIHRTTARQKELHDRVRVDRLLGIAGPLSASLLGQAVRGAAAVRLGDRLPPLFNLVISNVPGPSQRLGLGAATLRHFFPLSTLVDGQGLNITVQRCGDHLDVGLLACPDLVPDLDHLADLLDAGFTAFAAFGRPHQGRPHEGRPTPAAGPVANPASGPARGADRAEPAA